MTTAAAVHRYTIPAGARPPVLSHATPLGHFAYLTRRHAARVGLYIDVTPAAARMGFACAVHLTAAAWGDCIAWSDDDSRRQTLQHAEARLTDVLRALIAGALGARGSVVRFDMQRVPRDGHSRRAERVTLQAICDYDANGAPSITVATVAED